MLTVARFIKWRTALMELGVQKLNLAEVTVPIPEDGQDPYQMVQVHDYLSVSFLRMDPHVRSASSKTIELFSTAYPELLAHKYFVNVPAIMGWMYAAMKLFLAPATLKKFHPMSSGTTLATELPSIVDTLPKEYGGKGPGVKEQGQAVRLVGAQEEPAKEEVTQETPVPPVPITKEVAKPAETAPTIDIKTPEEQELAAAEQAKVEAVADTLAETKLGEKPAEVKAT
jgi:phosphatidylinositol transfer protein SFH5